MKKVHLSGGASPYRPYREYPAPPLRGQGGLKHYGENFLVSTRHLFTKGNFKADSHILLLKPPILQSTKRVQFNTNKLGTKFELNRKS